jgi:hypothetical protein
MAPPTSDRASTCWPQSDRTFPSFQIAGAARANRSTSLGLDPVRGRT